jgi:hypothetical protein
MGKCGVFVVDASRAREALRMQWGSAYEIGITRGRWWAVRLADRVEPVTGRNPDEQTITLRADAAHGGRP